jgi:hypothetical protein
MQATDRQADLVLVNTASRTLADEPSSAAGRRRGTVESCQERHKVGRGGLLSSTRASYRTSSSVPTSVTSCRTGNWCSSSVDARRLPKRAKWDRELSERPARASPTPILVLSIRWPAQPASLDNKQSALSGQPPPPVIGPLVSACWGMRLGTLACRGGAVDS